MIKFILIKKISFRKTIFLTITSLILLIIGSRLLIRGAVEIAIHFGISQAVIGLTLVSLGTSLPEMATACLAMWHKHPEIVMGNILGSNLFNILFILGIIAFIKPILVVGQIAKQDVWIMLAVTGIFISVIISEKRINRMEGMVFILLYISYFIWLYR